MNIAIYCSANADIHPDFFVLTEQLGRWAGENRHTIVFGGCRLGLMECVAQAARSAGGATIGYHHKPIILYNIHGFWNPLIALLNHLQQQGMVRGSWQQVIQVAESHEQLIVLLEGLVNGSPLT